MFVCHAGSGGHCDRHPLQPARRCAGTACFPAECCVPARCGRWCPASDALLLPCTHLSTAVYLSRSYHMACRRHPRVPLHLSLNVVWSFFQYLCLIHSCTCRRHPRVPHRPGRNRQGGEAAERRRRAVGLAPTELSTLLWARRTKPCVPARFGIAGWQSSEGVQVSALAARGCPPSFHSCQLAFYPKHIPPPDAVRSLPSEACGDLLVLPIYAALPPEMQVGMRGLCFWCMHRLPAAYTVDVNPCPPCFSCDSCNRQQHSPDSCRPLTAGTRVCACAFGRAPLHRGHQHC